MSKENALIKNTAIVTLGKICTQMISFFLLPLYTALLTTSEYGVVDLLNTLINLLVPILLIQVDQGVFRLIIDVRNQQKKENEYISAAWFFMLAQIVLYIIIFAFLYPFINNEYKIFLGTNLVFYMINTLLLQVSRGLGDNMTYAVGSFITGSFTVILNVIFIVGFKLGAYGMLSAGMIANICCAAYVFIKLKLYQRIKWKYYHKDKLKEMIAYSLPLVPNVISWWIVESSDRILISMFLGLNSNGIYSAANKFSAVIVMVYGVFNLTWTESAALNIESDDRDEFFSGIFKVILQIFGCICLGVIALMPFVFPLMINTKFADAYNQIPILMLGTFFNILIQFLGGIYVAKKLAKEIAKTSFLAAIINIVVNVVLIKFIGLFAASLSTLCAYFVLFIYRFVDSRKFVHLKVDKRYIVSLIIAFTIIIFGYYLDSLIVHIMIALIAIIYAIVVNLNNVNYILGMIKQKLGKA